MRPWFPALKARVTLVGSHSRAGESGTITNSPGKVFNGWTVALDRGIYVGAGDAQIRPANSQPSPDA